MAQAALSAAQAALPDVERSYLAGGPEVALVCELVAVYPSPMTARRLGSHCAYAPEPQVTVVYAKDCYPVVRTEGGTPILPAPVDVTAWTDAYLTNVWALYDGLLDAAVDGLFGECGSVTIQPANFAGPRAGVCSVRIPLSVNPAST